jgi:16S rRNA (cytosine1402-N4)-methyltransferase
MAPTDDDLSQLHRPVLLAEVLEHASAAGLDGPGALAVDGTVGLGGHAAALLEAHPAAQLLGLDRDPATLRLAARRLARFGTRVTLVHRSYADLAEVLAEQELAAPRAVLLDLGASSVQLDEAARGFSFRGGDAPADMRFDPTSDAPTAAAWLDRVDEAELVRVLRDYGGEPKARAVARALLRGRPFRSVEQLARAARSAALRTKRIDSATRTFQALRMAVNDEPGHLARGLAAAIEAVAPGGRVLVIAFHSGEERLVKAAFREAAAGGRGRVVTKKPIRSSEDEVRSNPRARPARLRVFEVGAAGERVQVDGRTKERGS